jgi:AcrR family transcriptional regulator
LKKEECAGVARPIECDDDSLLDAASSVLMREGPAAFTLAKAGAQAGVSAATFIKRFGSKECLFLRISERWVASLDPLLEGAAASVATPLDRVRAVALCNYYDLDSSSTASNQLAALAIDLQSESMRELLHVGWEHVRRHLARHVADAVAGGQLAGAPPPAQLSRIIVAAMEGGCLTWSVHPEGSLVVRLADDLDAILSAWAPHLKAKKKEPR